MNESITLGLRMQIMNQETKERVEKLFPGIVTGMSMDFVFKIICDRFEEILNEDPLDEIIARSQITAQLNKIIEDLREENKKLKQVILLNGIKL